MPSDLGFWVHIVGFDHEEAQKIKIAFDTKIDGKEKCMLCKSYVEISNAFDFIVHEQGVEVFIINATAPFEKGVVLDEKSLLLPALAFLFISSVLKSEQQVFVLGTDAQIGRSQSIVYFMAHDIERIFFRNISEVSLSDIAQEVIDIKNKK